MLNSPDKTAPGSGFHHNSAFRLAFKLLIVATLLSPCLSAPTADPWWYHPCDTDVARIRHSRSTTTTDHLVAVKRQLKVFLMQLNLSIKQINVLYKEQNSKGGKTPYGKFKWLKLNKMLKNMKHGGLPKFYETLHYFAGTLDKLRSLEVKTINTAHYSDKERQNIYKNITYQMRTLLCEVQDSLKMNNEKIPAGIPLRKMKIKLPKKSVDLTVAHILDLNFFKKTKTFFTKAQKLYKDKNNNKIKKGISSAVQQRT